MKRWRIKRAVIRLIAEFMEKSQKEQNLLRGTKTVLTDDVHTETRFAFDFFLNFEAR